MTAMELADEVRRLVQDRSMTMHTDAEIIALLARTKRKVFGGCEVIGPGMLSDEQEEALTIVVAFRLLQARDAAVQLEALATVQP